MHPTPLTVVSFLYLLLSLNSLILKSVVFLVLKKERVTERRKDRKKERKKERDGMSGSAGVCVCVSEIER